MNSYLLLAKLSHNHLHTYFLSLGLKDEKMSTFATNVANSNYHATFSQKAKYNKTKPSLSKFLTHYYHVNGPPLHLLSYMK